MSGSSLRVTADTRVVWEGDLGPVALEFNGPVGLRSDNARVVFDFLVQQMSRLHSQIPMWCSGELSSGVPSRAYIRKLRAGAHRPTRSLQLRAIPVAQIRARLIRALAKIQ
jgi:hypothetical protein